MLELCPTIVDDLEELIQISLRRNAGQYQLHLAPDECCEACGIDHSFPIIQKRANESEGVLDRVRPLAAAPRISRILC